MTISKKLYFGFGSIVVILVLLFIVNTTVMFKERSASSQSSLTLEGLQSLEAMELKMMQIRLHLQDYLLTGDTRQHEKMTAEAASLADFFNRGRAGAQGDSLRNVFFRMELNEKDWMDKFAAPLIAQRQRVEAGDATVADLQVAYATKDPNAWTTASMAVVEEANGAIRRAQDESTTSAAAVRSIGTVVSTTVTLLAILLCAS